MTASLRLLPRYYSFVKIKGSMSNIEDEIKRTRKILSRALIMIGIITIGAIVYTGLKVNGHPSALLADVENNVNVQAPVPVIASTTIADDTDTTTTDATAVATSTPDDSLTVATSDDSAAQPETAPADAPAAIAPTTPAPEVTTTTAAATTTNEEATSTNTTGWQMWWGNFSEASGTLIIGSTNSTNGGGALLAGSNDWTDYIFEATLDWVEGNSFGLLARYAPDDDYAACELNIPSPDNVRMYLDQYIGGHGTTLGSVNIPNYSPAAGSDMTVSIAVKGSQTTCSFAGQSIARIVNDLPKTGGIGFVAWDPVLGNSQILVKNVTVSSSSAN